MNSVREGNPNNYGEELRSFHMNQWAVVIKEEFDAIGSNGVWVVVVPPKNSHVLHTKWVFKSNTDADGAIERFKSRLVDYGKEQLLSVDYGLKFAAVMEMSIVKFVLVFSRRW